MNQKIRKQAYDTAIQDFKLNHTPEQVDQLENILMPKFGQFLDSETGFDFFELIEKTGLYFMDEMAVNRLTSVLAEGIGGRPSSPTRGNG